MGWQIENANAFGTAAWYALYTRHQHEKSVAASLTARDVEVFLPLYEETRNWSDRRKKINVPLFPGYVFVHSNLERRTEILMTAGVHDFVSFDHRPAPIPLPEMENLRYVARMARVIPHPFLRCGDWVRVKSGPFQGIEGFLLRRKSQARLVLSVELLQQSAAIEIDAALTERVLRACVLPGKSPHTDRAKFCGAMA